MTQEEKYRIQIARSFKSSAAGYNLYPSAWSEGYTFNTYNIRACGMTSVVCDSLPPTEEQLKCYIVPNWYYIQCYTYKSSWLDPPVQDDGGNFAYKPGIFLGFDSSEDIQQYYKYYCFSGGTLYTPIKGTVYFKSLKVGTLSSYDIDAYPNGGVREGYYYVLV